MYRVPPDGLALLKTRSLSLSLTKTNKQHGLLGEDQFSSLQYSSHKSSDAYLAPVNSTWLTPRESKLDARAIAVHGVGFHVVDRVQPIKAEKHVVRTPHHPVRRAVGPTGAMHGHRPFGLPAPCLDGRVGRGATAAVHLEQQVVDAGSSYQ